MRLWKGSEKEEKKPCYGKMDQCGTMGFPSMNNCIMYQAAPSPCCTHAAKTEQNQKITQGMLIFIPFLLSTQKHTVMQIASIS